MRRSQPGARGRDLALVAAAAALAYVAESVAWPPVAGRDLGTYLIYYDELVRGEPILPQLMLFRTPVAPLVIGALFDLGGAAALEVGFGAMFVAAVVGVYAAGAAWSRALGVAVAVALLAYPPFGALFHSVSSDAVSAFALACWLPFFVRAARNPTPRTAAAVGAGAGLLVLVRPGNGVFLAGAVVLLAAAVPRRRALAAAASFAGAALLVLGAWSLHNELRFGDFTVSRTSAAHFPLYRVFVFDRLVEPSNGEASRELARSVEDVLLPRQPYRSYDVSLGAFFANPSDAEWEDLVYVSDRTRGWNSDYALLGDVANEAILAHPRTYLANVARTFRQLVEADYTRAAPLTADPAPPPAPSSVPMPELPPGQNVPGASMWWLASTPDGRIERDWSGWTPELVFEEPAHGERWRELQRASDERYAELPPRDGVNAVALRLNRITTLYPSAWLWLAVGAVGLAVGGLRLRDRRVLVGVAVLGLTLLAATALGEPATPEYRLPVDPLLLLFAAAGAVALAGGRERTAT